MIKFKHPTGKAARRLQSAVAAVVILVVVALNLLLPYWQKAAAIYIDLTPEGLYSVSDLMRKEMSKLDKEFTITFCADDDYLMADYESRYVYVLARKLEKLYSNIHVTTVNLSENPAAVDEYKTTHLSEIHWDDVIISCGSQYRIMNAEAFWSAEDNVYTNFNGEFKLATALFSLSAFETAPTACFVKGHGEKYFDPENADHSDNKELTSFYHMLRNLGLQVKTLDLETEEIPSDCVLLIMNGPTQDYSDDNIMDYSHVSTLEKIDRFLSDHKALMVLKDPDAGELPALNRYLEEWGISLRDDVVRDKNAIGALIPEGGNTDDAREYLIATYPTADKGTIGYAMYKEIAGLSTSPRTILERCSSIELTWGELGTRLVATNVSRGVSSVFFSSATAGSYAMNGLQNITLPTPYTLAAVSVESTMGTEVDYYNSYVFVSGTTRLLSEDYLSGTSYCNYDVMNAVVRTISSTDVYADADLGGLTLNSANYGGKELWKETLSADATELYDDNGVKHTWAGVTNTTRAVVTVLAALVPVIVIPVAGIVIHNRRRYR